MIYNVHAGHANVGGGAIGAVGYLNESKENRVMKDRVIRMLREMGHTVYDCTVDTGTKSSVLSGIVKKCNEHIAHLDVSIHFNAGSSPYADGQSAGTECWVYSSASKSVEAARRITKALSEVGFRNRGVKANPGFTFLAKSKNPAIIVEVCFVDDPEDLQIYTRDIDKVAAAIVKGITGESPVVTYPDVVIPDKGESKSFTFRVSAKELNVRAGAGTSYKVVGVVRKGETYTITETSGSWGKLKSGAGWINVSNSYGVRV